MCHAQHSHDAPQHQHAAPGPNPVLDIGGEVGALVVYLADHTRTGELFACPSSDPDHQFHTGVHSRDIDGVATWVAIFPEIRQGTYCLLDDDGAPMASFAIRGGEVAQLDLRHATVS